MGRVGQPLGAVGAYPALHAVPGAVQRWGTPPASPARQRLPAARHSKTRVASQQPQQSHVIVLSRFRRWHPSTQHPRRPAS